jgi:ribose-phosphate pyrophosphokinase
MLYLNGVPVNVTIFPDKTSQVWKLDEENFKVASEVRWDFESEGEFLQLAQLKELLDYEMVKFVKLHISFLPYARQDKEVSNDATFALTTFSKLLNSLNFSEVIFDDVHSPKALKLIKNSKSIIPDFDSIASELEANVCFPDKGASFRYRTIHDYVILDKERDQETGALTMKPLEQQLNGKYLIVDDLCDGGGTFILAAKELYRAGASEVHLYTTHGLYTKGIDCLREAGIKRIFNIKGEV